MFQLVSPKWVLTFVCIICGLTGSDVNGQIGGWNGGYVPGNGFTPINGVFGGNPVGGFGNYGYGIGYSNGFGGGVGGGFGNPYGFYGGLSPYNFAQPIYSTFNQPNYSYFRQPIYSTRLYDPSIYVPPVINQPIYVPTLNRQQVDSNLSDVRRIQIAVAPKVNPAPPQATYDNREILIFSPPTNTRDVQYALNSATYTMKPGTLQKFTNDRVWTIETNVNGQAVKYNLSAGRYKFSQYGNVMNLYTTKENPESPAAASSLPSIPAPPAPASDTPAPSPMPVD
jgi:hypothetical protein